MGTKRGTDDTKTKADALVRVVALLVLVAIIAIDAPQSEFDGAQVELILASFVAGSVVYEKYKERAK